jgi:hypothetical protein
MDWLLSLVRIVGASVPGASSLLQLQAEIDGKGVDNRLRRLEDPISALHPDVQELAGVLYQAAKTKDQEGVELAEGLYSRYARPLALLDAEGLIVGTHTLARRFGGGLALSNPVFFMYMCALHEKPASMARLLEQVEGARAGTWLRGDSISAELDLPLVTVRAVFKLYVARGLGIMSAEIGTANYRPIA